MSRPAPKYVIGQRVQVLNHAGEVAARDTTVIRRRFMPACSLVREHRPCGSVRLVQMTDAFWAYWVASASLTLGASEDLLRPIPDDPAEHETERAGEEACA